MSLQLRAKDYLFSSFSFPILSSSFSASTSFSFFLASCTPGRKKERGRERGVHGEERIGEAGNLHAVVNIEPLRVVVHGLGLERNARQKAKRLVEVLEAEFLLDRIPVWHHGPPFNDSNASRNNNARGERIMKNEIRYEEKAKQNQMRREKADSGLEGEDMKKQLWQIGG